MQYDRTSASRAEETIKEQEAEISKRSNRRAMPSSLRAGAGVLKRITRMIFRHRIRMLAAIGGAILAAVFQLFIPRLIGQAVDNANNLLSGKTSHAVAMHVLLGTAALLLGVSVLRGLFTMFFNYESEAVGQVLGYDLRMAYYGKLQRLSFDFHDHIHSGDLMTRGMLDVEGVRLFVNTGIIRTITLAILIIAGASLLLTTNLELGLLSLSFVPFVGWRSVVTRLRLRDSWYRLQERLSVLTRVMDENLSGIRVVRAFAAQDYEMAKFDIASDRALSLTRHRIRQMVRNAKLMTLAFYVSMLLVLWIGGLKTISGEISVGRLTEFLAFMMILQMPVRQLGMMVNSFARASTSGERLFAILDAEPSVAEMPDAKPLSLDGGILRFENVGFDFVNRDKHTEVLRDVSFEVGPGRTIGIVGPPGSGKSTIAHLIPRFYDVTTGRITIDGQDIREVSLESLRRAISVVQQDNFIFTASIENNVAYGDPWTSEEIIQDAASDAQLDPYIRQLPERYGTLIGERGVSLSGGQRQRLSISRGLLLRPNFLILDDSTAAIDAGTEHRILAAIRQVAKDRGIIIISHRLSTLMHADEILFLERGRVAERGSHDELLERGGRYAALYQLQSTRDDGEEVCATK